MSRTSKKETHLTIEEALNQALVPDIEQLYKIPKNWTWVYLSGCAKCRDTFRKPVNAAERSKRKGNVPYYGATGQVDWINDYLTDKEYVLLGEDGAPFLDKKKNKAYIISGKAWVNNHVHILESNFGHFGNIYLLHYLNVFNYTGYVNGTTRLKLTRSSMNTIPVPLAPFDEQQRIVDRIEGLFAKLYEAKEKAQEVIDGFDDRRSAILNKAFTGELTQEWRDKNSLSLNSWSLTSFVKCIETMQNGLAKRRGSSGEPYVVLRLANLSDNGFITNDLRTILLDKKEQDHYELHTDDVLMIRVNGSKDNVGKQYMIADQKNWAFCDHLIRIKYSSKIFPQYMVFFSMSKDYRAYVADNMVSTAGQNTISRKGMANLQIPVPLIEEQKEIAYKLETLFDKEQQAKETAEQVIDHIEVMKKAILARAFRGELGTNDPNDEPAIELLKRVLSDESTKESEPKPVKKRITIPKELSNQLGTTMERKIIRLYFEMDTDVLSLDDIFSVSSKKLDVLDCIRTLEKKQIIIQEENGKYRLVR